MFYKLLSQRDNQFEKMIVMAEPCLEGRQHLKGLNQFIKRELLKYPDLIYADFHLLTYNHYRNITAQFDVSK